MPEPVRSLVGRTLPNAYPSGGTITITKVWVEPQSFTDDLPVICCSIRWNTGNPALDAEETIGSLAPGTLLWDTLQREHERES